MITILAALVLASAPASSTKSASWGAAPTMSGEPTPLAKALEGAKGGSTVLVTATAAQVCEKKGCWVVLQDGEKSVRVTMKDYGFFLPKDVVGKTLVVEGTLAEKVVTEKERRHYAEDAGKSKAEIAKIEGDETSWSLVASSIRETQ